MITNFAIETIITKKTSIQDALTEMFNFRYWSNSTKDAYLNDVKNFELFCHQENLQAKLGSINLHHVQKWITYMTEENTSTGTIKRRLASLSSIFSFYKDLGIIKSNPFKAIAAPVGCSNSHSAILTVDQLKELYFYLADTTIKLEVKIAVKLMLFTGLRNAALTNLKVKDLLIEQELLKYDAGIYNSKHKIQFFPLPPQIFKELADFIKKRNLKDDDFLIYGLKGLPLKNKQLNRITDQICNALDWHNERRVTPHGFRATIATLLDERGNVGQESIKYLLGHGDTSNLAYYLRRDYHKINRLRSELTLIERELIDSVKQDTSKIKMEKADIVADIELLALIKKYPELIQVLLKNK